MSELIYDDVELLIGGSVIDDLKGFSAEISDKLIEFATFDGGKFAKLLADKKDLKINCNGNQDTASANTILDIIAAAITQSTLTFTIRYKTAGVGDLETITGVSLVESAQYNADMGSDVLWSAVLTNSDEPVFTNKAAG